MDATTLALGIKCFIAGTTGVFVVMAFLQISIQLTSKIVISMEKSKSMRDTEKQLG